MSEHQYIEFRAIDAPVSDKNLEFMRRQSTRAEITPWVFKNEYHYGDFNGDALEMLRRGYDLHFHYANFGIRRIMIRLPDGLRDAATAEAYFEEPSLGFAKDKKGPGGVLVIDPGYEPGDLDDLWEPEKILKKLLPLRNELFEGDMRPLYLARLAVGSDVNHDSSAEHEGPVPAGLNDLTNAQRAMASLYGISDALLAVAARNSPPLSARVDPHQPYSQWLHSQPEATKNAWLVELTGESRAAARAAILAEYQKSRPVSPWPTVRLDRTIGELRDASEEIQAQMDRDEAERAADQRFKKLSDMRRDPAQVFQKAVALVQQRSLSSYEKAAGLLADLREAVEGTEQAGLAEEQARTLKERNPKLHNLTAALRREGFLKKE